jgi:hypothetical protein
MRGMLEAPWLVPVPIPTINESRWRRLKALFATRRFYLGRDWHYYLPDGRIGVIPGGFDDKGCLKPCHFDSDGKSYPRIFRPFMNNTGIGLVEGLAHDFIYRYKCQILSTGEIINKGMTRKQCDEQMRLIGIQTNNMKRTSDIAYYVLRIFGRFAWNQHRRHDGTDRNDVYQLIATLL